MFIETEDYSVICQTENDIKSKKIKEGFACKKYSEGRMEIGRFKYKENWKDSELDNWIGGVLDICKDQITFRQYDENGKIKFKILEFDPKKLKWKRTENVLYLGIEDNDEKEDDFNFVGLVMEEVDFTEDDENLTQSKLSNQVLLEATKTSMESSGQHKNSTHKSNNGMLNSQKGRTKQQVQKPIKTQIVDKQIPKYKVHKTKIEGNAQIKFPDRSNESTKSHWSLNDNVHQDKEKDNILDKLGIRIVIPEDVIKHVAFKIKISNLPGNSKSADEVQNETKILTTRYKFRSLH